VKLGFNTVVKGLISHGEKVFANGKIFVSYDWDGHNGGTWKVARKAKTRDDGGRDYAGDGKRDYICD
jgi:hypothetical protein